MTGESLGPDDEAEEEFEELATEYERRFAMLDYLLHRTGLEELHGGLHALAEKLNLDEEQALPEYEAHEARSLDRMSAGRDVDELRALQIGPAQEPAVEGLRRRLLLFYLLSVVDEDAEGRAQALELAAYFQEQSSLDLDAAIETLEGTLALHEDQFFIDYLHMTDPEHEDESEDGDEHDGDSDHGHAH